MEILQNTFYLNIFLIGALVVIALLLLAVLSLRKSLRDLRVVCATDDKMRRILTITDDLLGKLPNAEVEAFVVSPDFEIYKEVMEPIIGKKEEHEPESKKTEPPKKAESPKKVEPAKETAHQEPPKKEEHKPSPAPKEPAQKKEEHTHAPPKKTAKPSPKKAAKKKGRK